MIVAAEDVEVAKRFRAVSRAAVETGDREGFDALSADDVGCPDAGVGDAVAGLERGGAYFAQHQPATRGKDLERNCWATLETARMRLPSARTKTH
jgi:hypothetical protein